MKKSVFLLLCCLSWAVASLAQHPVGIWKDGVTTIVNDMDSIVFTGKEPTSPDAVGIWKGGVPDIISGLDSIVFNRDYLIRPEGLDLGIVNEPTETEVFLQTLSSDEESAEAVVLSHEDSVKYNSIAEEVLAMFAADDEPNQMLARRAGNTGDEYADEAMRKRGKNVFEWEGILIDNHRWNSGTWGPTLYGDFYTYYTTFYENGKRYLFVVFYEFGGFKYNRRAFLKLGQVNNGKVVGDLGIKSNNKEEGKYVKITKGQTYAYQRVCIDEFFQNADYGYAGCVSFFPLIITENGGQRDYSNPIYVHTKPLMNGYSEKPREWAHKNYGFIFGTVNNVPVYCNTSQNEDGSINWNIHGGGHQCVDICKRYIVDFYPFWTNDYASGSAKYWEDFRRKDPDHFTVYDNNGVERVREGDIVVWNSAAGHVGVVIHCEKDTVWVAHQNGGDGLRAYAIGALLSIDKSGRLRDINPYTNNSSIYGSEQPIPVFIRVNLNEKSSTPVIDPEPEPEPEPEPVKAMTCDVTSLDFGEIEVGTEKKLIFNVTNTGETTLTISSVSLQSGSVFSVSQGPASLGKGVGQGYNVTFKPTQEGTFTDKITIRTDAKDHPVWTINITGKGKKIAEQWGEKKMICSGVADNTQYTLYKQPNLARYRTNSAGTKFYQTRLIVDVTYQGVTVSSPVTSDVYIDPNGAQSIMALTYQGSMDSGMGMLVVFTSSKAEGNNNLMNGYAYITGYQSRTPMRMFFSSEQTEHVFENKNYGWYPTFFYDDSGTLAVRHFCPDNNKIIESYYDYPVWESYEMGTTTKSDYENFWKNLRKPQFLEEPNSYYYGY